MDWIGIATNSLWILALAASLAAASFANWTAHMQHERTRAVLARPPFPLILWSGMTLFCVGLAFSIGAWWERTLWGLLALLSAFEGWHACCAQHGAPEPTQEPPPPQ